MRTVTGSPMTRWRGWMAIVIAVHSIAILALGLFRHWGYMTSLNDLGVFNQAV